MTIPEVFAMSGDGQDDVAIPAVLLSNAMGTELRSLLSASKANRGSSDAPLTVTLRSEKERIRNS